MSAGGLEFVFLGTGTSAGVPAIACDCAVCKSSDPRDQRLRTSAALRWVDPDGHDRTVLIDCSPDLRAQALRAGLGRCDAVFFTHNHVDHTWGLDELRRFNAVQHAPIPVYAEPHTQEHLRRVYAHIFDRRSNVNDSFVATLTMHELRIGEPVELFGLRFEPVRLIHGKLPIAGFRIERAPWWRAKLAEARGGAVGTSILPLAYCTDVSGIPPETYARLRNLQTLALDCLREKRHPTHLTLQEAVEVAGQVSATGTYFIHMAHDLPHQETCDRLPPGMTLAYDGLILREE